MAKTLNGKTWPNNVYGPYRWPARLYYGPELNETGVIEVVGRGWLFSPGPSVYLPEPLYLGVLWRCPGGDPMDIGSTYKPFAGTLAEIEAAAGSKAHTIKRWKPGSRFCPPMDRYGDPGRWIDYVRVAP